MLFILKTSFLFFILSLFTLNLSAQKGMNVTVNLLRNNKGHVLISLYKDCIGFPNHPAKAYRKAQVAINNNSASFLFEGLQEGNYTIAIMHDENDDQKMNTNFFGIPKEGYGFSNNVMGTIGPPSCKKASVNYTFNSIMQITIKARYGW